ncbi:MAG: hypothetical protein AAB299_02660, partial [Thermodesulfobacteriota bacterium]
MRTIPIPASRLISAWSPEIAWMIPSSPFPREVTGGYQLGVVMVLPQFDCWLVLAQNLFKKKPF